MCHEIDSDTDSSASVDTRQGQHLKGKQKDVLEEQGKRESINVRIMILEACVVVAYALPCAPKPLLSPLSLSLSLSLCPLTYVATSRSSLPCLVLVHSQNWPMLILDSLQS